MNVTHLYCSSCGKQHEPRRLHNVCNCGKPLMVAYDLDRAQTTLSPKSLASRAPTLWRYEEVLPFMPRDTPRANIIECQQTGAHVTLVDGLITDCGRLVSDRKEAEGWFDLSTLKEPYRVEGKKTMGYELAEQLGWELPDVILYPTGGGTGLIGMWKAFDEMEQMGWIGSKRPRMIVVQAEGCAPIVNAFKSGQTGAEIVNAHTVASGLRVPRAIGDFIMLDILHKSGGNAVTVTDEELLSAIQEIGAAEGLFVAPEGGACLPALKQLINQGEVSQDERVVLFNTGSGLKYLNVFQTP